MKPFYVMTQSVIAIVFGYGHYLASDDFTRWLCVFLMGAGSIFNGVLFRIELETARK